MRLAAARDETPVELSALGEVIARGAVKLGLLHGCMVRDPSHDEQARVCVGLHLGIEVRYVGVGGEGGGAERGPRPYLGEEVLHPGTDCHLALQHEHHVVRGEPAAVQVAVLGRLARVRVRVRRPQRARRGPVPLLSPLHVLLLLPLLPVEVLLHLHVLRGLDQALERVHRVLEFLEDGDVGAEVGGDGVDLRRGEARLPLQFVLKQRHELRQIAPLTTADDGGAGSVDVHKVIRLVDNFLLNHLLQDVLQRDDAGDLRRLPRVIVQMDARRGVLVQILDRHLRFAREQQVNEGSLKVLENAVQSDVVRHAPDVSRAAVAVKGQYRPHLHLIVRVHQNQILNEEDADNVRSRGLVNWDAGETTLVDFKHDLESEPRVELHHEALVQIGHHLFHSLHLILEGAGDELMVLVREARLHGRVRVLHVDLDELLELVLRVHGAQVLAQHLVQHQADGPRDRQEQQHEEAHDPYRVRTDDQPMAGARGLRDDLSQDDDEERGDDAAEEAACQTRQQNGDQRVDHGISQ
mmetsp:Transcript_31539/g.53001  ORF Transcript_31539/g.53001 Transcript_31539/m.53001 type:complete len:523 (+) Transcript_31539:586-2154(+)